MPPAPGLLSTTTGCPRFLDMVCAIVRARKSVLAPAANGAIRRIGRLGKSWVCAALPVASSITAASHWRRIRMGSEGTRDSFDSQCPRVSAMPLPGCAGNGQKIVHMLILMTIRKYCFRALIDARRNIDIWTDFVLCRLVFAVA